MSEGIILGEFFARQVIDERKVEALGFSYQPKWAEGKDRRRQGQARLQSAWADSLEQRSQLPPQLAELPQLLGIDLIAQAQANTHLSALAGLLRHQQQSLLWGGPSSQGLFVAQSGTQQPSWLRSAQPHAALAALDAAWLHQAQLLTEDEPQGVLGLVLPPSVPQRRAIVQQMADWASHCGVELSPYLGQELWTVRGSQQSLQDLLLFPLVDAVLPIRQVAAARHSWLGVDRQAKWQLKRPDPDEDYPVVGVLDSGIEPIEALQPWLWPSAFRPFAPEHYDTNHGTFVAGMLVYGRELNGGSTQPGCYVYDAAILPKASAGPMGEDRLLELIRQAVAQQPGIRVWNLSISMPYLAEPNRISHLAAALDDLQQQQGILICKSCGNRNAKVPQHDWGVSVPAEGAMTLTVGSGSEGQASPFSRVGGSCALPKPEVLVQMPSSLQAGVCSFDKLGLVRQDVGTSFATPVVAYEAATLLAKSQNFEPWEIRALLVHGSQQPSLLDPSGPESLAVLGEPVFQQAERHTARYAMRGRLEPGKFLELTDFPFPAVLRSKEGHHSGRLRLTLATQPKLMLAAGAGYVQTHVRAFLGTYAQLSSRPQVVNDAELSLAENENLLKASLYKREDPAEQMVPGYGQEFLPIRRWVLDLDGLSSAFKNKWLSADRRWYLRLQPAVREFARQAAKDNSEAIELPFLLAVDYEDPSGKLDVQGSLQQFLHKHSFRHSSLLS